MSRLSEWVEENVEVDIPHLFGTPLDSYYPLGKSEWKKSIHISFGRHIILNRWLKNAPLSEKLEGVRATCLGFVIFVLLSIIFSIVRNSLQPKKAGLVSAPSPTAIHYIEPKPLQPPLSNSIEPR